VCLFIIVGSSIDSTACKKNWCLYLMVMFMLLARILVSI
jgi:hypothetical protein